MRKGMKLLAALAAATTASTMSLSAFAVTVKTSTEYTNLAGKTGDVTVKAEVTDAQNGEEVAFVVYKADTDINDAANIIYIDQKTANGSGATSFSFTDTYDKVIGDNGAQVAAGTTSVAASSVTHSTDADGDSQGDNTTGAIKPDEVVKDASLKWSVENPSNGYVYQIDNKESLDIQDPEAQTTGDTVTGKHTKDTVLFYVVPKTGYKLEKYTLNSETNDAPSVNESGLISIELNKDGENELTFKFSEEKQQSSVSEVKLNYRKTSLTGTERSATIFATVTGTCQDAGMIIKYSDEREPERLSALAIGSDGKFAVTATETQGKKGEGDAADYQKWTLASDATIGAYADEQDSTSPEVDGNN